MENAYDIRRGARLWSEYLDAPMEDDKDAHNKWIAWRREHEQISYVIVWAVDGARDHLKGRL